VVTRRKFLAEEQRTLVRRVTTDRGGVQVVVGQAGAGKTAALAAAAEAFDSAGIVVRGCALAARAALQLQQDAGITSTTIARVLRDLDSGDPLSSGSVLVVDEAGMVDTRTLARLLAAARDADAKLVLVGDPAQLPELAAGGLFAGLLTRLDPIVLTANAASAMTGTARSWPSFAPGTPPRCSPPTRPTAG
jgi:ATP-dependent exoDNAse (exonuclease V) alpha subunit